ncbi:MAG: DNA gyrase C-terminal beta-propeller domain-containing protein, partial [Gemmatimonadota bacterium]
LQGRGGQGVINIRTSGKSGKVVSIKAVTDDEQLMLITRNGVVNRQAVEEISTIGRATQGVRLMNLDEGDVVVDVARVVIEDEEEEEEEATEAAAPDAAGGGEVPAEAPQGGEADPGDGRP